MRPLTNLEVAPMRLSLLKKQGGRCVLCGAKINGKIRGGAVLDHDHVTGCVRAVLCRVCNSGEGKVNNCAIRYGGGTDKALAWLKRLVEYRELHLTPQTSYSYPEKKKPTKRRKKVIETT